MDDLGQVLNWEQTLERRQNCRGTVVFTNGVFDLLHRGHLNYLIEARKLGQMLIVGVNSDDSARTLNKGPGRPINNQDDRSFLLAQLTVVDIAVIFNQPTPKELIEYLKPDIIVKGGDYQTEQVVGKEVVEGRGGKVVIIPLTPGYSTTSIIDKITTRP
jgi:D-beta-D-heptose 7-phosphate kinase/D-beta-D-heptose 1-phosphate adenosyltransferase